MAMAAIIDCRKRDRRYVSQRQRGNAVRQRIAYRPGIYDPKMPKPEVGLRGVHGLGRIGRIRAFELETPASAATQQQQIEFGTSLRGIEIRLAGTMGDQCLLQREAFTPLSRR